jgi:hypothetical protein
MCLPLPIPSTKGIFTILLWNEWKTPSGQVGAVLPKSFDPVASARRNDFPMPKPSDDLSDEQLHHGLATGEYEGRDALVAEEILRRRHEERARTGAYRLGFIGAWAAAFWLWIKVRLNPRRL